MDEPYRFGTPEECAAVAEFLAGPLGRYVSGEVIKVNGASARL
jgi:NAD(P)-dependent dehydrogenase (short-subunit alcohol dehydrogenase family)